MRNDKKIQLPIILFAIACISLLASETRSQENDVLLQAAKQTGVLTKKPTKSYSRNNFDSAYQKALLKHGYFDELVAYKNPEIVSIRELNRICFEMAKVGLDKEAVQKVAIFKNRGRIANLPDFDAAIQPGLLGGKLLNATKSGDLEKTIELAEKLLDVSQGDSSESIRKINGRNLFEELIFRSLEQNKIKQAAELFQYSEQFGRDKIKYIGFGIVQNRSTKAAAAIQWLELLSRKHPLLAIDLAGRCLKTQTSVLVSLADSKHKRKEFLYLIRKIEKQVGHVVDTNARSTLLQNPWLTRDERNQILDELRETTKVSGLSQGVPTSLPVNERIHWLNVFLKQCAETDRNRFRKGLVKAYLQAGQLNNAQQQFDLLNDESKGKRWLDFGLLAIDCQRFDKVRSILASDLHTMKYRTADPLILELALVAAETSYSESEPLIRLIESWPASSSRDRSRLSAVVRFMVSDAFISRFAEPEILDIAEDLISSIPEHFFPITSTTRRNDFHYRLISKLIADGQFDVTLKYIKRIKDKTKTPLRFYFLVRQARIAENFLEELLAISPESESTRSMAIRYYKKIGNLQRAKSLARDSICSLKCDGLTWRAIESDWVYDCLPELEKIDDQDKLFELIDNGLSALVDQKDVELIIRLVKLLEEPQKRCRLFLRAANEIGNESGARYEFPMQLPKKNRNSIRGNG